MRWMALRPRPMLYVPKARRSDDRAVSDAYGRKRDRGTGISPFQSGLNIFFRPTLALGNGSPPIERGISPGCRLYQSRDVVFSKRFQANVSALEYWIFHAPYYAMS